MTLPQVVLGSHWHISSSTQSINAFWRDSLVIPAYLSVVSVILLLLHAVFASVAVQKVWNRQKVFSGKDIKDNLKQAEVGSVPEGHGEPIIIAYNVARLVGCLAVTGLSIASLVTAYSATPASWSPVNVHLAECVSMGYISSLSLISIIASPTLRKITSRHLGFLLLVVFGVYFYRDIRPLATFSLEPVDSREGWLLWSKIIILAVIAVVVPLVKPRQYTPLDSEELSRSNPEETASILSLVTFTFLDPLILLANRVPHLATEQLPPIASYNRAQSLVKTSYPTLDPFSGGKQRHLFWGLLSVLRADYFKIAAMLVLHVLAGLANPLGVNQLLRYIETGGDNTDIRPWFWVVWLLLCTVIGGLSLQWHNFLAVRLTVQADAILTSLIYDHALRIRMKAEVSDSAVGAGVGVGTGAANIGVEGPSRDADAARLAQAQSALPAESQSSKDGDNHSGSNIVGRLNNLVTTDIQTITRGRDWLLPVLYIPLQVILSITFLYYILGWSAFVALAVLLALFPVPGFIASKLSSTQTGKMKAADERIQTTTETVSVIRMIKLFGWERKMEKKISDKRVKEIRWVLRGKVIEMAIDDLNFLIPFITMMATFGTYTFIMKESLTASIVFSAMTVLGILQEQMHLMLGITPAVIKAKVSLDRIGDFLRNTELLDEFTEAKESDQDMSTMDSGAIGFRDATFSWSAASEGAVTPSRKQFRLHLENEVLFKPGQINLVVGPTGCGKTSLLMALLGEMHFIPSVPGACFNLPRGGGVAFAAQESWVLNETIKDNILFGSPYDAQRYKKVISQCALTHDIELFEAGDQTEVGEKGLTLSGGQKARLTLARAVYSSAEILLLDDVLAALDVHTAKHIVKKCFSGDLIKDRTVILVTHNVALASPIANYVVSLSIDGRILSQGSLNDALALDKSLLADTTAEQEILEKSEEPVGDTQPADEAAKKIEGKLIVQEDVAAGFVSWEACKLWFAGLAGRHPYVFWTVSMTGIFLVCVAIAVNAWWLGQWAAQYDHKPASEVAISHYLGVYGIILLITAIIFPISHTVFLFGTMRASKVIHDALTESVLGTTLRWLDITPTSRITTRLTQDIATVDDQLPTYFIRLVQNVMTMAVKLISVFLYTPIFIVPSIAMGGVGAFMGKLFGKAQLSVQRELSNSRAPVLGHFEASVAGLVSIRAYGAQSVLRQGSMTRIDRYSVAARTTENLDRWIDFRSSVLGGFFLSGLAAVLVYGDAALPGASDAGFALSQATGFNFLIMAVVRLLNMFQVSANSLERIDAYINIEQEPKPTVGGTPPAYWPASGDLRVEKLSARYSPGGPKVLNDISFDVKAGERVGIVGRTGSGKSSLTLSLLRCIPTEGSMYYDGIPTHSINLDALRSNITIIPQVPELLAGTLRQNVDPFDQYEDAALNDALRASGLFSLQGEMDGGRITLDTAIAAGGGNLSVGQRQILALARAIVRGSKLLILDEATSAIDYKTDSIIQSSLRNELGRDVTLLVVAHRLQTIMDSDKIMVLDAGRIVEFDSPRKLLQTKDGFLRRLVDESGDRDALIAMAEGK
ncbi:P-loop containing nucleoside triphosphate hydrolase protein [Athelia psychrophila]|uniref:P-loop containing nucleoside triphosphate hydrolase protein n=1 Tax=Athelia psychrophila TaxID=1759441 RepID=A0A166H0X0_9AGAM|nr:P-loop containing nucleoside triphosphate hydrolase protein [Fibularhizoctonia sp. CBS 109695]